MDITKKDNKKGTQIILFNHHVNRKEKNIKKIAVSVNLNNSASANKRVKSRKITTNTLFFIHNECKWNEMG